uniref:DNA-directed RNA polymerase subunit beta'' n=1 Tax=Actinocyclus subtilis TaxID=1630683 RepID=A0A2U9NQN2_9STRA|nr:RNA polymerase beta' subunit [Actinocyclus subtilis]AWT39236.1 RNA polymerase beta' subunit [Actinocyclus subtilis]
MENYIYQNTLISKKQLKQLLAWCFTKYGSIKACFLADELKYLGFKYATQAGISISIEDLHIPEIKNNILNNANQEILNTEKICLKGKITEVERYQKIIDKWNITSESLKNEVVSYFKKYDPLNSVFMMAFSGARGNLSQVRQLVGMRGLMSDPSGQIMNLPIKKNFREGLSITDYLMSGYGARKGIVDTALKTANSGYLTRRLIDVAQDIIIREKDCLTNHSFLFSIKKDLSQSTSNKIIGRILNKSIYNSENNQLLAEINTQITPNLIKILKQYNVENIYLRSPLTCRLYRSICQTCYGWDLATEKLIDMGEAVGIIAGQSIGEPGTQLTMRTFHTGGIFTSETDQQLISPINGIINFSNLLKTSLLRTNRGENVLLTENSGSLSILPKNKTQKIIQIELSRNTILFVSDNQFVQKNYILGQLSGTAKQIRTETKPIISDNSGEVYMPRIKSELKSIAKNKLLWILSGKVYQAPICSFINFYFDSKINNNSFIFRSKIINQQSGIFCSISNNQKLSYKNFEIFSTIFLLKNAKIQNLILGNLKKSYLLIVNNLNYVLNFDLPILKFQVNKSNNSFGKLISKDFLTATGGILYYANKIQKRKSAYLKNSVSYLYNIEKRYIQTIIWLPEEIHQLNSDNSLLLIRDKSLINKNVEILPNLFSKTAGYISIEEKQNIIQEISIKPGFVYKVEDFKQIKSLENKVFFPGEILLNQIKIDQISLCQIIKVNSFYQLLLRPINLYEIPFVQSFKSSIDKSYQINKFINLKNQIKYSYNSGEKIKKTEQIEIINIGLNICLKNFFDRNTNIQIEILPNRNKNFLNFSISNKSSFNQYIPADLKYTNIQPCFIVSNNQFIHPYTILGFLEIFTQKSLEIVKLKSKRKQNKQLFLISNQDCITIPKNEIKSTNFKTFLFDNKNLDSIGKVLINNNSLLTIQKGRPYFFPNCKNNDSLNNIDLKYKFINFKLTAINLFNKKNVHINYRNITNKLSNLIPLTTSYEKFSFPKLLIKKRGKYYSSGIPILVREFLIHKKNQQSTKLSKLDKTPWYGYLDYKDKIYKTKRRDILNNVNRVRFENLFLLVLKSSELISNKSKNNYKNELATVGLLEHPFRNIGIHSITEDYFEKEVNSVYCKNGEFIENGQTIGLLNFEKEITGDIVQGLPRIEELLEARKKKRISKHIPKSLKKSLLIRKTTIDPSFEFRKIGTTVKENEKINPHNLLKIYFNYFAKIKYLIDDNSGRIKLCQLSDNYEASYKSFKKVQSLILNSVQSVYQSQGVTIANKHLEVIIKQMTTKVLITHEGNTPLLPREVIDLYHINYINQIVKTQNKFSAFYVPLLLGITKAALNNPSFISAASFQETTKVLTKAAVEGRLDWLRGLKETIIIGHLIPSGTGYKNYVKSFQKNLDHYLPLKFKMNSTKVF